LVEANILTPDQLESVLARQQVDTRKLGQLLVESGLVSETRITQILSQQLSVPWVSLYHIDFSQELLALVPRELADRYGLIPIYVRALRSLGDTLYVAMEDPMNEEALRDCAQSSGLPTRAMIAAPSEIRRAIRIYYGASDSFRAARAVSGAPAAAPAEPPKPANRAAVTVPTDPHGGAKNGEIAAALPAAPSAPEAKPVVEEVAKPAADDTPVLEVREVDLSKVTRKRRQLELTLLDGTTLRLPSHAREGGNSREDVDVTAILAALRAAASGKDAAQVGGRDLRWEKLMAAVIDVLLRKHLILERELAEALAKK
jgi:type IV pilus assembly protein PilB